MKLNYISFKNNSSLIEQLKNNSLAKSTAPALNTENSVKQEKQNNNRNYCLYSIGLASVALGLLAVYKRKNIAKFFQSFSGNSAEKTLLKERNIANKSTITQVGEQIEKDLQETVQQTKQAETLSEKITETVEKNIEVDWKSIFEDNDFVKTITTDNAKEAPKQVFASNLCSVLGAKTQEFKLLGNAWTPKGMEIRVFGALKSLEDDASLYQEISKNFAADAYISNRNVLKSCRLDKNNNIVRFDFTETLGYKADGERNYFGRVVEELSDFFNPEKYPENAKIYANMTREDLIKSLEKIVNTDSKNLQSYSVTSVLTNQGELAEQKLMDILLGRKNFVAEFLAQAKSTQQENLDMKTYTELLKINTIKNLIKNTNEYSVIKDLQHSIGNIKDEQISNELKSLIESRVAELTCDSANNISMYGVEKILEKYVDGFKFSESEAAELKEIYGSYAGTIMRAIADGLDSSRLKEITQIINMNEGKYLDFWKNNPEKMVMYINSQTTTANQLEKFSPNAWDFVIKNFKLLCERDFNKDAIDAITSYSGFSGYDQINGILRSNYKIDDVVKKITNSVFKCFDGKTNLKNEITPLNFIVKRLYIGKDMEQKKQNSEFMRDKLKEISDLLADKNSVAYEEQLINLLKELQCFINKIAKENGYYDKIDVLKNYATVSSKEDSGLILNRTETILGLDTLQYKGESIAALMGKFRGNSFVKDEIADYLTNTQPLLYQPGFLSTSISPYKTLDGNVKWRLKLGENVRYNYISDIDHIFGNASDGTEAEVLINPGHVIKITKALNWRDELRLFGEILPPDVSV